MKRSWHLISLRQSLPTTYTLVQINSPVRLCISNTLLKLVSKVLLKLYIPGLIFKVLFIQAIATSIDALSTGFTFADYTLIEALICVTIIAIVTFIICVCAVYIGKKFGTKLGNKAEILGGIILIIIGVEIFLSGVF